MKQKIAAAKSRLQNTVDDLIAEGFSKDHILTAMTQITLELLEDARKDTKKR